MGHIKLEKRKFGKKVYRPIEFQGQNTGTRAQADKIASNIRRYQIPCRIIKASNGEYAVYRED